MLRSVSASRDFRVISTRGFETPAGAIGPTGLRLYAAIHCAWFALYAFLGKGFAYAGVQPVYAGEILLASALIALLVSGRLGHLLLTPVGVLMSCFTAWQLACMIPYLNIYGLDVFRDSVIWAYSLFAWVVAALMIRFARPVLLVLNRYRSFSRAYLILGPAAWLTTLYLHDRLPVWPGSTVTIPMIKGGDYAVQLAGIFAFTFQGLAGTSVWWTMAVIAEAVLGMASRGGLVAFLGACGVTLITRPRPGRLLVTVAVTSILIVLMAAFDVRFTPPGTTREISVDLLSRSLSSVVSESERGDLENTKTWRLGWWARIRDYTVNGPYFWTGKGYGINLANSDGFQVGTIAEPLRSPHNSHLTFLARSGVPGFAMWIALQLAWALSITRSYLRARRVPRSPWAAYFAWLLAFWVAFVIEAGFDVSFEGPMAGIPFWTIFGLGWGSQIVFMSSMRSQRDALGRT